MFSRSPYVLIFLLGMSCMSMHEQSNKVRYVALGDSYTICEGASESESWPVLLAAHLNESGIAAELVANPSRTGYTTQDLIDKELAVFERSSPTFATLLIGVNDWVRGVDEGTFRKNLVFIIDRIQSMLPDKKMLVLITIPDFGVTPSGKYYGGGRDISAGISSFNAIIMDEAKKRDLKVVDIFPVSKEMKNDPELVASDKLHPSAKEYAIWEKMIFPVAREALSR
jgi:acyl-CoA thioesterase I